MAPTISCRRCGHPFSSSEEAGKSIGRYTPEKEDDVAAILEEVHRFDDLIDQLKQDRAKLLNRVNNLQAATRHLPSEVLSTIFQFARPPIDFDSRPTPTHIPNLGLHPRRATFEEDVFQLVLGAVSYHWRQAAWATPQLWTTISVEIFEPDGENNMSLLNLYFENSRGHLMTVELDFRAQYALLLDSTESDTEELYRSSLLFESIKTLFFNNAANIQNLIVTGLPIEWTSLVGKDFLRCESITMYWPSTYTMPWSDSSDLLDLTQLPNLHHFRVMDPIPFTLPWSTITTLRLSGAPISLGVDLLIKCPNLVELKNIHPERAFPETFPSLNQLVMLKHLESLTWSTFDDEVTSALMRYMRFSKLRVLRWHVCPYDDTFSDAFYDEATTFFSSLPETLRVLEFDYTWFHYRITKTILTSVPHLAELVLVSSESSYFSHSLALSMIGRSATGLVEDIEKGRAVVNPNHLEGPKILPRLMKLKLMDNAINMGRDDVVGIVEMLEALHGARVMQEHFRLEMAGTWLDDTWSPEVLARLKRLAESGFNFEILLNLHRLDYMSYSVDTSCL